MSLSIRTVAFLALFAFLTTEFAHAARLPRKLARQQAPTQATGTLPTAPVPPQIAAAHTVFLSNDGADANFPGTSAEAYNAVYHALQQWGRYQLVSTPAEADLLLKLRAAAPVTGVGGGDDNTAAYAITSPAFALNIVDAHTGANLWTITSPVNLSAKRKERARWYAISVTNLVSRIKVVANEPLSNAEQAELTEYPKGSKTGMIILLSALGAMLATGIAVPIIMRNHFNDEVQQQQAALCKQNPFFCTNAAH